MEIPSIIVEVGNEFLNSNSKTIGAMKSNSFQK
jgi:hypothetical protein